MKYIYALLLISGLTGCSIVPYKELNLDTTSNFRIPEVGKAGIYVYQWKTGVFGSGFDVTFRMKGVENVSLNTGEYAYFELPPGEYEYRARLGFFGLSPTYYPVTVEANQNYFFRVYLHGTDRALLITSQSEIDEVKVNILTQRYEEYNLDSWTTGF